VKYSTCYGKLWSSLAEAITSSQISNYSLQNAVKETNAVPGEHEVEEWDCSLKEFHGIAAGALSMRLTLPKSQGKRSMWKEQLTQGRCRPEDVVVRRMEKWATWLLRHAEYGEAVR
jgi:hypothetical protein